MKKTLKSHIALLLAVIMMLSTFSVGASALYADDDWKEYYSSYMDDGSAVLLQPGSDDSQRNFSWYSPAGRYKCSVSVSENPDMSDAKVFAGTFISTPNGDRSNKVTVTGLEPGKTYYYICTAGDDSTEAASFSTFDGDTFSAVYVTDIHISDEQDGLESPLVNQSYTLDRVLSAAQDKKELDLLISAGDQASSGLRNEYMSLIASPILRSVPFALCVGNHDRRGYSYKYFNNNPNKYTKGISSFIGNDYWYVKGDVLFMVFDSNCKSAQTHRNFVKSAIAQNPDVMWRVAVMHHDMYGRLSDGRLEDSEENRRPVFVPIFDEFKIDLVLLGHSHFYTVSKPMYNFEVSEEITGTDTITNPKGTVFMVSGSINRPKSIETIEGTPTGDSVAYTYVTDEVIYNIIDFSSDSITVNSYTLDGAEPFHTYSIEKTTQNGGHPAYTPDKFASVKRAWYEFLAFFEEFGVTVSDIFKIPGNVKREKIRQY